VTSAIGRRDQGVAVGVALGSADRCARGARGKSYANRKSLICTAQPRAEEMPIANRGHLSGRRTSFAQPADASAIARTASSPRPRHRARRSIEARLVSAPTRARSSKCSGRSAAAHRPKCSLVRGPKIDIPKSEIGVTHVQYVLKAIDRTR